MPSWLDLAPLWCHLGAIDLRPYVENIQNQLVVAAAAGADDTPALAQRLLAPLDASIRLALQDALSAAAEEITCELAPGSVELRVRGGDLEFAVTPPPVDAPAGTDDDVQSRGAPPREYPRDPVEPDDGGVARINLRMPESLKARAEQAAAAEGLSVNSWLVRAAATALERGDPTRRPIRNLSRGKQRYTGWAR
jgi:hypothetical protein